MRIRLLGAHNTESQDSRYVSLLVDDALVIDAGAVTASLSFTAQQKLQAVLLTHQHYDHVRDIPAIGMNFFFHEKSIDLYSTRPVFDALTTHLLNDVLYPNFMEKPPDKPVFRLREIEPGRTVQIGNYEVLAVAMNHAVPAVGYQISSKEGKSFFYSSDTGPGLAETWKRISPRLLIIEVTAPNRYEEFARRSGHLTPGLLLHELKSFRELKGYLPQVLLIHMNPLEEKTIRAEVKVVARSLGIKIGFGREGMQVTL